MKKEKTENKKGFFKFKAKVFSKPKIMKMPEGSVCAICGVKKPLDWAHLIPMRFLKDIKDIDNSLIDQGGKNTIILCRNHHSLFDNFQLEKEDLNKIFTNIFSAGMILATIFSKLSCNCPHKCRKLEKRKEDILKFIRKTCNQ